MKVIIIDENTDFSKLLEEVPNENDPKPLPQSEYEMTMEELHNLLKRILGS
jgi:hypothetical protein